MGVKSANEITVKVISSKDELINKLETMGFKKGKKFSMDDYYFIPSNLEINKLSSREILSKAVLIRYIVNDENITQKITFKIKDIDDKGNIISQKAISCEVLDINDAKNLFKAMGYFEIMNIKEKDVIYYKDDLELILKFVENSNILIEIETNNNTRWNTIEKLKLEVEKMNLPIEKGNYFVKKAEDMLNKKKIVGTKVCQN